MVRLQRVTFLALHNYLGLTTELFNPVSAAPPTQPAVTHAVRVASAVLRAPLPVWASSTQAVDFQDFGR
jgi:lysophospholipid hydrolase